MSWFSDLFGGSKGSETTSESKRSYVQLPEFPEADWARQETAGRLKDWGAQPGYGAIPTNWNDLWNMAKKKTSQYFWGDAMGPGLSGKLKANVARQNIAGQPAEMRTLARMGAKEADMLSDIAVQQALGEAQESEQGRRNWMSDLFNLMKVRPNYQVESDTQTQTTKDLGGGEGWGMLADLGSAALPMIMSRGNPLAGLMGLFGKNNPVTPGSQLLTNNLDMDYFAGPLGKALLR